MSGTYEQHSEVAWLLTQINAEYEAAQRGLAGLAQGISRHQFITRRMERIGEFHSQLCSILGNEAIALVAAQLEHTPPRGQSTDQEQGI